jgi:Tol biopolymer transport system component
VSQGGSDWSDIYVMDVASGARRQLTQHFAIDTEPTWSPNGREIAFTSDRGGQPQIYVVPAEGGTPVAITEERYTNEFGAAPSPDGTRLVYVANNQLYLRSMSDLEARPIPGTQQPEGQSPFNPVFSPDGQSIAFYSQADGAIKKIAVSGGAAVTICPVDVGTFGRMNWDASGIVFNQAGKGIMRVSANGSRWQ